MTIRGFTEKEFIATAEFIHEGVQITLDAKRSVSGSKLQDFMTYVGSPDCVGFEKKSRGYDNQVPAAWIMTDIGVNR